MRFANLFFSLINLLFAVLLLVLGIFIFMIPRAPHFQEIATNLLSDKSLFLSSFGIVIAVIGILLLVALYALNRRHCYYLKMGSHILSVEETVIQKYLSSYWKGLFPASEPHHDVTVKNNQIHLTVDLPYVSFEEQKKVLEQIETDLQKLFAQVFDYRKEFFLTVSFREKPTNIKRAVVAGSENSRSG